MKKTKVMAVALTALAATSITALASCVGGPRDRTFNVDMTVDTRGVKIDLWTGFGTDVGDALDAILDDFTAQTGIEVEQTRQGGYDNLQNKINLSAGTSTYPNVALGYPDHFAGYVRSDIIVRLDGYIENDHLIPATREAINIGGTEIKDESDGLFHELPAFNYDDFFKDYTKENETIEFNRETGEGYILGLPFNKSTEVMVYNKTFFDNPNIKALGIYVPSTWDEVKGVGTKILNLLNEKNAFTQILGADLNVYKAASDVTAAGTKPLLDLTLVKKEDFRILSYDSQANFFITAVRQWGGTYTEFDPETGNGYVAYDSPETVEALTYLSDLYDDNIIGIPQSFQQTDYCSDPFKNYLSLLNVGSSGGVTNAVPQGKFDVGAAPIPYKDAEHKYVISQGTNLCLLDKGSDKERVASWKLVKYLSQVANDQFAIATGYFPTCESALNSEDYQGYINATTGTAKDMIKRDASKVNSTVYMVPENDWHKFVDAGFVGSSTIRTTVGTITAQVFIDHTDPQAVIDETLKTLSDYVR